MLAQGVLSWVGQAVPGQEPSRFEARLFDKLFRTFCVADLEDDWLEDLNPLSLTTVEGALATPRLAAAKAGDKRVSPLPQHYTFRPSGMLDTVQGGGLCADMIGFRLPARCCSANMHPVLLRFQLERLGFFCVDPDSSPSKMVVNRTCSLKADHGGK